MDAVKTEAEDQTKSVENGSSAPKSAAAAPSATPKRGRIIDEDDDEEFVPSSVTTAPKPARVAQAKVEAKASPSTSVKKSSGSASEASKASVVESKAAVKSEVKKESEEKPVLPKSAAVKKSASVESPPPVKRAAAAGTKKKASVAQYDDDETDSDGDYDAPVAKRKMGADGEKIPVEEPVAKKAATPKKASAKASAAKAGEAETESPAKRKTAPKKAGAKSKGLAASSQTSDIAPPTSAATKEEKFKWWEAEASKVMKKHPEWKWASLSHQGVVFPPPYVPHGVKMLYDGQPVTLSPAAEEAATMFAKQVDGPHYEKPTFRKNFFADFLEILNSTMRGKHPIKVFSKCDFTPITKYLKEQAEIKKGRSKEEKEAEKQAKLELKKKYGYAMVNGVKEPLGNFMVEPPGLFLGRGDHPKAGMIKKRIGPEDITLNLSRDAEVPPCPIPGKKWADVVHNHEVGWVAGWFESITGQYKYIQFAAASSIKGKSDRKKYEKARLLKDHIKSIRKDYNHGLRSKDPQIRQRSTVVWMLDVLALRVGNEKKEDEADTVGCCSLRVEHVKLLPPSTIEFDFLGKDSMRYNKVVAVPQAIYDNIESFQKGKRQSEDLFDLLSTSMLNDHLKSLMPGLTAKVFRTYNASITLQEQLSKFAEEFGGTLGEIEANPNQVRLFYNRANRQVAILCNHQKTVSKGHQQQLDKIDTQIADLTEERTVLKQHLKDLKAGKAPNPKKRRRASDDDEEAEEPEYKLPTTPESTQKRIAAVDAKIEKLEADKIDKGEGAQIQNSTSKINYMDPRITIAFCNKAGLPLNKVFPATLLDKFAWAIAEVEDDPDFQF
jgi:DNA topoisomerase-1